jgi:hypothetical protein
MLNKTREGHREMKQEEKKKAKDTKDETVS